MTHHDETFRNKLLVHEISSKEHTAHFELFDAIDLTPNILDLVGLDVDHASSELLAPPPYIDLGSILDPVYIPLDPDPSGNEPSSPWQPSSYSAGEHDIILTQIMTSDDDEASNMSLLSGKDEGEPVEIINERKRKHEDEEITICEESDPNDENVDIIDLT
jgi:hypothetical protein